MIEEKNILEKNKLEQLVKDIKEGLESLREGNSIPLTKALGKAQETLELLKKTIKKNQKLSTTKLNRQVTEPEAFQLQYQLAKEISVHYEWLSKNKPSKSSHELWLKEMELTKHKIQLVLLVLSKNWSAESLNKLFESYPFSSQKFVQESQQILEQASGEARMRELIEYIRYTPFNSKCKIYHQPYSREEEETAWSSQIGKKVRNLVLERKLSESKATLEDMKRNLADGEVAALWKERAELAAQIATKSHFYDKQSEVFKAGGLENAELSVQYRKQLNLKPLQNEVNKFVKVNKSGFWSGIRRAWNWVSRRASSILFGPSQSKAKEYSRLDELFQIVGEALENNNLELAIQYCEQWPKQWYEQRPDVSKKVRTLKTGLKQIQNVLKEATDGFGLEKDDKNKEALDKLILLPQQIDSLNTEIFDNKNPGEFGQHLEKGLRIFSSLILERKNLVNTLYEASEHYQNQEYMQANDKYIRAYNLLNLYRPQGEWEQFRIFKLRQELLAKSEDSLNRFKRESGNLASIDNLKKIIQMELAEAERTKEQNERSKKYASIVTGLETKLPDEYIGVNGAFHELYNIAKEALEKIGKGTGNELASQYPEMPKEQEADDNQDKEQEKLSLAILSLKKEEELAFIKFGRKVNKEDKVSQVNNLASFYHNACTKMNAICDGWIGLTSGYLVANKDALKNKNLNTLSKLLNGVKAVFTSIDIPIIGKIFQFGGGIASRGVDKWQDYVIAEKKRKIESACRIFRNKVNEMQNCCEDILRELTLTLQTQLNLLNPDNVKKFADFIVLKLCKELMEYTSQEEVNPDLERVRDDLISRVLKYEEQDWLKEMWEGGLEALWSSKNILELKSYGDSILDSIADKVSAQDLLNGCGIEYQVTPDKEPEYYKRIFINKKNEKEVVSKPTTFGYREMTKNERKELNNKSVGKNADQLILEKIKGSPFNGLENNLLLRKELKQPKFRWYGGWNQEDLVQRVSRRFSSEAVVAQGINPGTAQLQRINSEQEITELREECKRQSQTLAELTEKNKRLKELENKCAELEEKDMRLEEKYTRLEENYQQLFRLFLSLNNLNNLNNKNEINLRNAGDWFPTIPTNQDQVPAGPRVVCR